MGHIFISYSHKDTQYAHQLARNLHELGVDVWIDERLDYGSQWPHEIQKQLDGCDAFIIVMSPRSYGSEWVQSELQRAKRKLKPIFPVLLEGDEPWLSVESTQFYDVRDGKPLDEKFYGALKRVVSSGPDNRTFTAPRSAAKAAQAPPQTAASSSKLKTGLLIGGIGALAALFIFCIVAFIVLKALFPSAPSNPAPTFAPTEPPTADLSPASQPTAELVAAATETFIPSTDTPIPSTFTSIPPTATSIPPTSTPVRDTTYYLEAENGKLGNGAYVDYVSTASKGAFVNFSGAGTVKFTLNNMKAGQYTFVIHYLKYANNSTAYPNTGFQNLYVNNSSNPISVYYTKTFGDGDPVNWNDASLTVVLDDGTNTLLIAAIPGDVGGSVDYIYLNIIE